MRAKSSAAPADPLDTLLRSHLRTVQQNLCMAGGEGPVGFVMDFADDFGREAVMLMISHSTKVTEDDAEARIETGQFPIVIFAQDGTYADTLLEWLATMDPSAREHFDRGRYLRSDGEFLVVVIAAGRFASYQVPSGTISDGQHRTASL